MRDQHKRDFLFKLPPFVFALFFTVMTKWTVWTVAHQAPLSMEFFRQEYQSGQPFPSPGDLSDPEIEPGSPALQEDSLPWKSIDQKPWENMQASSQLQLIIFFLLQWILSYTEMKQPWVYMCSPSRSPLPPPSPPSASRSSQCTRSV